MSRRKLEGVLMVDKPAGPTSHDVVARARIALGMRRIGHTGTLDPFASGLLLLCLGKSTRIAQYLSGMDKTYRATARLGVSTDTNDLAGETIQESGAWRDVTEDAVRARLEELSRATSQVPPQYSAKKVGGEPMYRKARRGESVALSAVPVTIRSLVLLGIDPPFVHFETTCSSGTYIRAIARDLGTLLGTGAHLTELRRPAIGDLRVEDAITLSELDSGVELGRAHLSPARALAHLPRVRVSTEEAARLAHGQSVEPDLVGVPEHDPVAILLGDRLVAVGYRTGDALRPRKVLG